MALTEIQRRVCRLLATNRISSGESYVAGGVALNELIGASRLSRDIDLFHDTNEALEASWRADRELLEANGFAVRILRERIGLVEAEIDDGSDQARLEWARDSAFRFFPLQQHEELGLTLHPFDLATNKVLAMVGRLEVRDWVDLIASDERVQPLGYLAWAASGKDPGFGPGAIVEAAARTGRYSAEEVGQLAFEGEAPDAGDLARAWRGMLGVARETIRVLPPDEAGACVLHLDGGLMLANPSELARALEVGRVHFHRGAIRGALPRLVGSDQSTDAASG
ncbi:MAG: hypothetical protein U9O18_00160 [Chloroflexota bacterium]|nr:hypothetical protein [Chloroflexota bacterium]